ncbi:dockerin type I domain-containing protein, partial [Pirellulales bacterium]|nr:dockerin type I domain-containing protein [Pirellulales bacterium]
FGNILQSFTYNNASPWPAAPNAGGPSLEYAGPLDAGEDPLDGSPSDPFDNPANWQASAQDGGSPGEENAVNGDADFNNDALVSGIDFLVWQRNLGATAANNSAGDANGDNEVDETDLAVWETQFGMSVPVSLAAGTNAATTQHAAAASSEPVAGRPTRARFVDAAMAREWLHRVSARRQQFAVQERVFEEVAFEKPVIVDFDTLAVVEDLATGELPNRENTGALDDAHVLVEELFEKAFE